MKNSDMPPRPKNGVLRILLAGFFAMAMFLVLWSGLGRSQTAGATAEPLSGHTASPHLGYGFNVHEWDLPLVQGMGFDWIKVFFPPGQRAPVNVLMRVDAQATDLSDVEAFGEGVTALAAEHAPYIEAYEIGNEVNLDASFGWGAPPVATDYIQLLCEAYGRIKEADPTAVVVSAGLAPTGRVSGAWQGHAGHDGHVQDEREYMREFLEAGGAACADAIGYHPYGFAAAYDAGPDVASPDPDQDCSNGFCFRGVEPLYAIVQSLGAGDKQIWATELGWIVQPPDHCLSHPSFAGREWHLVSEEEQAVNLAGAFAYAHEEMPWMGPMFVFNLNFNTTPFYEECEQMRYFGIEGRPAEEALREMPKYPASGILRLAGPDAPIVALAERQPLTKTLSMTVRNRGWGPLTFTTTVTASSGLEVSLTPLTGTLAPQSSQTLSLTTVISGRLPGVYRSTVTAEASPGTGDTPAVRDVEFWLVGEMRDSFLPFVRLP